MRAPLLAAALTVVAIASMPAYAQSYPNRPIRVIVPQPPGGGFDLVARVIAEPLARVMGNPVVVDNRPGAGMLLGTEAAAKADADGYTILLGAKPNLAFNAGLYDRLPYDPRTDFVPVGIATFNPYTLVARNDLPFASLNEILAYAKANPGKLTYASAGNGTGQHITAAVTFHLAGVQVTHVPYKGAAPAYQDLLPGRVDLFFDNSATAQPQIEARRVKPIAVSGTERLAALPDVPTVRESGLDFDNETWIGYFVRAGTPAPIVARLRADFDKVLAMPEITAGLEKRGYRTPRLSGKDTEAMVARDIDKWTQLIRSAGIRASD
ncbi:MAG TPA: tripartite tricarboxylate transporter substrate binding protein [Burkholderiales bacterium]|jgi:tripartite-type tricarboxylate transporter receptor subunit TctC|nr:tripartite tricarboxylate transporter substrate binding protein [Burkholderiales bacterium]